MSTILKTAVRTLDESFSKLLDSDTNAEHITKAMRTDSPIAPGPDLVCGKWPPMKTTSQI
jgi:hypothetical protein